MNQSDKIYKLHRVCNNCKHQDELVISKRELAFELVDINKMLEPNCSKCLSASWSTFYELVDLDTELLSEWATNEDLYLMPQDEELLLAEEKYLDMILLILNTIAIPANKRDALMDALCILVYDNSKKINSKPNDSLRKRVIEELNKRQDKLMLADRWIMDYIKNVVYPQLNLDNKIFKR